MTAPTIARPTLREVILDALNDAFYSRRANVEECACCAGHPAGACADHQEDAGLARDYEDARKQVEQGTPEAMALLGGTEGGMS
jgi:hypothetical protein